jgi:hypothetical protein
MATENESMFSELVLGLNGGLKEHAEFQALFELVNDALDSKNSTQQKIALATAKLIAETRFDLLDGTVQEGSWANKEDGYLLVYRDMQGWSLWFNPEWDELTLQRNFYKKV